VPENAITEHVYTAYWFWPNPPRLNMPAVVEVRVWESGEHKVETPLNIYIHWECAGGESSRENAKGSLVSSEEFARLKVIGALTYIGQLPIQPDIQSTADIEP
jgi:hypothetical protein